MPDNIPFLVDFLRKNCTYVPETALLGLGNPSGADPSPSEDHNPNCPMCLSPLASSPHRVMKINTKQCRHAFDADCLSRYILAGYNKCPLCRAQWYEIPDGATTARTVAQDADVDQMRLSLLLRDILVLLHNAEAVDDAGIEDPNGERDLGDTVRLILEGGSQISDDSSDGVSIHTTLSSSQESETPESLRDGAIGRLGLHAETSLLPRSREQRHSEAEEAGMREIRIRALEVQADAPSSHSAEGGLTITPLRGAGLLTVAALAEFQRQQALQREQSRGSNFSESDGAA